MANRQYNRGRSFEHYVRDLLVRRYGARHVFRCAGSKSFADLIAFWPDHKPAFVQCKLDGRLKEDEWAALYESYVVGANGIVAWRPKRGEVRLEIVIGLKAHGSRTRPTMPMEEEYVPEQ